MMKKIKRIVTKPLIIVLLWLPLFSAGAQEFSITQIDTARLLSRQQADVYLSLYDQQGQPVEGLSKEDILLEEKIPQEGEEAWEKATLVSVEEGINQEEGITFFLVLDNSGSMYDTLSGEKTRNPEETRMGVARRVLRDFLGQIDHPGDKAGLASFNTYFTLHQSPGNDPDGVIDKLNEITQPEGQDVLTELYASLVLTAEEAGKQVGGRQAVILLSDGENYPFYTTQGEDPHPLWGKRLATPEEAIEAFQQEGITLYALGLGAVKDPYLQEITAATGGKLYDARTESDLSRIYGDIRSRMLKEYRLRYRPTPATSREKVLRVTLTGDQVPPDLQGLTAQRPYYSSSLLGDTRSALTPLLLIPLLLGLALLALINLKQWHHPPAAARLTVLDNAVGTVVTPQVTLAAQTRIGGSPQADLTVAGDPSIPGMPATIMADASGQAGGFTIVAGDGRTATKQAALTAIQGLTVNHQPVKPGQKLENGDVLTMGGATIIFEEPE